MGLFKPLKYERDQPAETTGDRDTEDRDTEDHDTEDHDTEDADTDEPSDVSEGDDT